MIHRHRSDPRSDMDTPRKPLRPKIIATVIVVLLLLYVASWWPIRCMSDNGILTPSARPAIQAVYAPMFWLADHSPAALDGFWNWYLPRWELAPYPGTTKRLLD